MTQSTVYEAKIAQIICSEDFEKKFGKKRFERIAQSLIRRIARRQEKEFNR
jgi:hypothetical protein